MGIDVPDLDDRQYEDLLADVRKQIPIESEDWTDHNAHDPGITILETLTWLSESYRYQLDRIEDRHRRKYLQLLGVEPAPPRPATSTLEIEHDALAGETVPARSQLVAADGRGDRVFETTRPVTLTGATVAQVHAETPDGRTELTDANRTAGTFFRPFGRFARAGSTMYLGFEGDPFADPTAPLELAVDFHESNLPAPADHGDEAVDFEPTVELSWEFCTDYGAWERFDSWSKLDVLADTTDALYGSGFVRLANPGPARWPGVQERGEGVLSAGTGLAWLRVQVERPGHEVPPQVDRLRTNVVPVEHRARAGPERLRRPDGSETTDARPGQEFAFERAPVLDADIEVGGTEWTAVTDFDASGPADRHYVLEESEGRIRFGDNVRGAVPEAGQTVVATSYEFGGGTAGNLAADADWWFAGTGGPAPAESEAEGLAPGPVRSATVRPLGAGSGGRAAEGLDEALVRLQRDLAEPYRAVTADDCEYLAEHTPGLRFGRTNAVVLDGPESRQDGECVDHDVVEVVVVPYAPSHVDRPVPSEGFLEAVDCHLERHRLVTDRVDAVPPTYVGIGVEVEVRLFEGYAAGPRSEAVVDALDLFLSPLEGFDGSGWPFGRSVYRSELYETVENVEGVDCVLGIEISVAGDPRVEDGEVDIDPGSLVYPTDHSVAVDPDHRECKEVR